MNGVWELPVLERRTINESYIKYNAKYHYYEYEEPKAASISPLGKSLCGNHTQMIEEFDHIESGEILSNPHLACKRCFNKWKKMFNIDNNY